MIKITDPGIYPDFPEADYFLDPCPEPSLTQSIAKVLIDQSALHAKEQHPRLKTPDDEDEPAEKYIVAKAIGNAAHAILIGRGKTIAVGAFDSWRTKEAKEFRDTAETAGHMPILQKHMNLAHAMSLAAKLQLVNADVTEAFKVGKGEVVIAAKIDGIWLRSLVDWMVTPTLLFDYKTTAMSVAPHAIPNLMADAGWPIQAAMQERILDVLDPDGAGRRKFYFIAQENYKPFAATIHLLPESTMTMGRKMLAKAETMWRRAMKTGKWEGYAPVIHRPELPGWKESRWLERELADEANREPQPGAEIMTDLSGG